MVRYTERFLIMSVKLNQISVSNNTSFLSSTVVAWEGVVTLGPIPIAEKVIS